MDPINSGGGGVGGQSGRPRSELLTLNSLTWEDTPLNSVGLQVKVRGLCSATGQCEKKNKMFSKRLQIKVLDFWARYDCGNEHDIKRITSER